MVRDDDGIPCAGFRECGGQLPNRSNTQVPLELRCATDANAAVALNNFSGPEYLFMFTFNRNLPYDPVRPWKDSDGLWYATISADACNSTVPCAGGGALYLYSSPALRGAKADWQPVSGAGRIMFASNWTVLTPFHPDAVESNEFVTSGRVCGIWCPFWTSSLTFSSHTLTLFTDTLATFRATRVEERRVALRTIFLTRALEEQQAFSAERRTPPSRLLLTRRTPTRAA
jgi:hypothetical protein